jgi:hypothetical protein
LTSDQQLNGEINMKNVLSLLAALAVLSTSALAAEGRHYDLRGSAETMGSFSVPGKHNMYALAVAGKPVVYIKKNARFLTAMDELYDSRGFRR